jgi:hypothetical protein
MKDTCTAFVTENGTVINIPKTCQILASFQDYDLSATTEYTH